FFFSSRRRHTRSKRDWSSDVCSSDLGNTTCLRDVVRRQVVFPGLPRVRRHAGGGLGISGRRAGAVLDAGAQQLRTERASGQQVEIGRASCRERGESRGGEGGLEGKKS